MNAIERPQLSKLRLVRALLWEQCKSYKNVLGCAIGEKISDSSVMKNKSIVFYVEIKKSNHHLKKNAIPRYFDFKGERYLTDVIEMGGMRNQFGMPPYFCRDKVTIGTISAMCKKFDQIYAATCAHNLKGPDLNPYSQDAIEIYDPYQEKWVTVGSSDFIQYSRGFGMPGNYGFTDAGLIFIEDQNLLRICRKAKELSCATQIRTDTRVWAKASNNRLLTGNIVHVEADFNFFYSDICILVDRPGIFAGDSGVLWKTNSNLAIAVHAQGAGDYGNGGAIYSHGMLARRMEQSLMVKFIEPI